MLKDAVFFLSMCALSPGQIVNIGIVSYARIDTYELWATLASQPRVDVVVLNVSLHHQFQLLQEVSVHSKDKDLRLIIPEEVCNPIAEVLRQYVQSVACYRSLDVFSSIMLYVPVVQRIVRDLMWSSVVIITDDKHASQSLSVELSSAGVSSTLVVFNSTSTDEDLYDMLHTISLNVFPWHFLLVINISDAFRVLQVANSFDVRNRRRSDMRSSSQWLILVQEGNLDLFHTDIWLDNIAVLVYPAINISTLSLEFQRYADYLKGNMFTLMYRTTGRKLEHVGSFDHGGSISKKSQIFPNTKFGFNGRRLTASTMRWFPYVFTRTESGKVIFEGICVHILKELANVMNFTYQLILPPDFEWGVEDSHGNWTGLVGQIQRNEVDMTVAPLALATERLEVMDFSYPFGFDHGVGIYKLPDNNAERWLTLIRPFTWLVHSTIAATFIVCVLSLYALRRWHTLSGPEDDMSDTWLVMFGLFIRHSPQLNYLSLSSSFLVSFVGLFGSIIAAIYCGNLIAFFTVSKQTLPFTTLPEVIKQTTYKWGTLGGSLWASSFHLSNDPDHKSYWNGILNFNTTDPEVLHTSEVVHKAKVKRGNYVFVVEGDILRGWAHEDCSLKLLSDSVYPMIYGLGLPKHSPYKKAISEWIMIFYERGLLDVWRRKWMTEDSKCITQKSMKGSSVTLMDLQSAFYILAAGIIAATVTVALEWRCGQRPTQ